VEDVMNPAPASPVLIRGGYVLTLDDKDTILPEGDVLVEGDAIVRIDRAIPPPPRACLIDARSRVVMPGLINSHMHSDETLFRGLLDNMPLEVWMLYSLPPLDYGPVSQRLIYLRTVLGAIELLANGTTTVQDDVSEAPRASLEGSEAVLQAYLDVGIRANVACNLTDKPYYERLPFAKSLLPSWAMERMRTVSPPPARELLALNEELRQRWHGRGGRIQIAVSASAPQRCTDGFLLGLDDLSRRWHVPLLTHALETKVQVVTGRELYGTTIIDHLDNLGILSDRLSVAHGIWMTDPDVARIAEHGTIVVHNPVSNLKLGSGLLRLRSLLDRGVTVALGTDGSSSNDSFNMFEVMKHTALIHKVVSPVTAQWPSAREVLHMVLSGGVRSTLLHGQVGVLAPGHKADIVVLRRNTPAFTPLHRFWNHLVYCENGRGVETVLVGGRVVVRDGRPLAVNADHVYEEIASEMPTFLKMLEVAYSQSRSLEPALWKIYQRCQAAEPPINRFSTPREEWNWPKEEPDKNVSGAQQ
jgi:5-methylthioadenosine/S-adenosylhomocysteine deaminase